MAYYSKVNEIEKLSPSIPKQHLMVIIPHASKSNRINIFKLSSIDIPHVVKHRKRNSGSIKEVFFLAFYFFCKIRIKHQNDRVKNASDYAME